MCMNRSFFHISPFPTVVSRPNPPGSITWEWNSSTINSQDPWYKEKCGIAQLTCSDGFCFFLFDFDVIVKNCPVLYDVSYNLR